MNGIQMWSQGALDAAQLDSFLNARSSLCLFLTLIVGNSSKSTVNWELGIVWISYNSTGLKMFHLEIEPQC